MIQRYAHRMDNWGNWRIVPVKGDGFAADYVLYADHEAAMKEVREQLRLANIDAVNEAAANADLLEKLERSNDAWIKAKEEIERLKSYQKCHEAELGVCQEHCEEIAHLRTKLKEAHHDGIDTDSIQDGFGSWWSVICPQCGKRTMEIVRPGKVQCSKCG